jgi:preprotein translocase subunit SecE
MPSRSRERHLLPARLRISGAALIPRTIEPAWRLILERGLGAQEGCPDSVFLETQTGSPTMAFSPFKFLQEVRTETAKVTWPTRRETMITTLMVFVMVALASIFFFVADQLIRILVTFILGINT